MAHPADFRTKLESKVAEQLQAQRVGYLLGAGSAYLDGNGYPLSNQLWGLVRDRIGDSGKRAEIQAKLDSGAKGLEDALDQLDDGSPSGGPHRQIVIDAIADYFQSLYPPLTIHIEFVKRLHQKDSPFLKLFTLNYDPLIERAAEQAKIRLYDGFAGHERAYFDPTVFDERIFRVRGTHRDRQVDETSKPIHLIKLHGSLGCYECPTNGTRRCAFSSEVPSLTKRLMIPPQVRKANETMSPPYSILWSAFRGSMGQDAFPLNRLACLGYGFLDEHVNAVIEGALARSDFTVLIFSKLLSDESWARWSTRKNVVIVTEARCSLKGETGPGHVDLWRFERLAKEV
jgi:hypothetical protein